MIEEKAEGDDEFAETLYNGITSYLSTDEMKEKLKERLGDEEEKKEDDTVYAKPSFEELMDKMNSAGFWEEEAAETISQYFVGGNIEDAKLTAVIAEQPWKNLPCSQKSILLTILAIVVMK